jgi:hypothetical protein
MLRKIFVAVMMVFVPAVLAAQTTNATLTGFITDQSKAIIVGAKIDAINVDTNVHYPSLTNNDGAYTLPNLPPGTYKIEVEKQGFKSIVKTDLILHVQDTIAINFTMAVGSMSESVTVTADSGAINTTDGAVSTVIDHDFIENMPLNGNSLATLFELVPGVLTNAGGSPSNGGGI